MDRSAPRHAHYADTADMQYTLALGRCMATVVYGQLIAENARCLEVAPGMIAVIFDVLVSDLSAAALTLAALSQLDAADRSLLQRVVTIPRTTKADWDTVATRVGDP